MHLHWNTHSLWSNCFATRNIFQAQIIFPHFWFISLFLCSLILKTQFICGLISFLFFPASFFWSLIWSLDLVTKLVCFSYNCSFINKFVLILTLSNLFLSADSSTCRQSLFRPTTQKKKINNWQRRAVENLTNHLQKKKQTLPCYFYIRIILSEIWPENFIEFSYNIFQRWWWQTDYF